MAKLTELQAAILAEVERNPEGTTIKAVAEATGQQYAGVQQRLTALEKKQKLRVERLRDGGYYINYYYPLEGPRPDSDDPLERAFAAPSAEVDH